MNKRILIISPDGFILESGISKVCENYVKSIPLDYRVDFIFRNGLKFHYTNASEKKVSKKYFFFLYCIYLVLTKKYSVIFIFHINYIALSFLNLFNKNFILIAHGIEVWKKNDFITKFLLKKKIKKIITVSKFTKKKISQNIVIDESKIEVISPKVDISYFKKQMIQQLFDKKSIPFDKYILFIGRLAASEKYKGLDELIESSIYFKQKINFIIVGEGTDKKRLQEKYKKYKNKNFEVSFMGKVSDSFKYNLLESCTASILCGYGEGFGISLLESIVFNKKIIASKLDATNELVVNKNIGISVDPRNLIELAKAITIIYNSRSTRKFDDSFTRKFDISHLKIEIEKFIPG